jgi:hypothetical protein
MRRLFARLTAFPLAFALLLLALMPLAALAQQAAPIPSPPGFAEVRARFENLTPAEVAGAGYVAEPACISSPAGGMGVHAINRTLHGSQFSTAQMDPQNPPILLLSGDFSRVVGLEWEEQDIGQGPPTLWGQTVPLLPGHPGITEPHYMLHAYFRPDGQVLFSEFDPALSCPPAPSTATADREHLTRSLVTGGVIALISGVILTHAMRRRAAVRGRDRS